jgi:Ca2+-binding RTX toxin-like protein
MAVSSTFNPGNGALTTTGDNLDNTITTSRDATGSILINAGAVPIQGGTATVTNTGLIQAFGQDGNDTISLDETNGALPSAKMFGGLGNDTVIGGSGADQLLGEAGDDTLLGKGGIDILSGGDGDDTLTGGTGNDQLFGEAGNDRIIWNPGDGSDLAEGGDGTDILEVNGGNGAETLTITPNGTRVRVDRVDPAPFSIDAGTIENIVINANGGDDVIVAGNGLSALTSVRIDGGAGNDAIVGGDGADVLLGGDGNDVVAGGRASDVAFLGAGDDVFTWNPGDGSDVIEGQAGFDRLEFNGANANETFTISANGGRATLVRDVGAITMDLNGVEAVAFHAFGGADNIVINDLSGTDLPLGAVAVDLEGVAGSGVSDGQSDLVTVNATAGNDVINVGSINGTVSVTGASAPVLIFHLDTFDGLTVNGGAGNDKIDASALTTSLGLIVDGGDGDDIVIAGQGSDIANGGNGNDLVIGGRGDDFGLLGAGDDVFTWNPGDGSDRVAGQAGVDRLNFNGANVGENIDISANGGRVRFFRDVANVTMDLDDVEVVTVQALGGADNIVVNDLSGTDLRAGGVLIDLASTIGGGTGDAQTDTVTVNGATGNDAITIRTANGFVGILGSSAPVAIFHAESTDHLVVNGNAGNDLINASALAAAAIVLTVDGGAGDDTIVGGQGADNLIAGDGSDIVIGGRGDDVALLGGGNDVFVWNPGEGSDVVEGQDGVDQLAFIGFNANENVDISANGGRVRFVRDVANITMDLNDVERIDFHALGGADNIVINDLTGTDAASGGVTIDLQGVLGSATGDGQIDMVNIFSANGDEAITVTSSGSGGITIAGGSAPVNILFAEGSDQLIVHAADGNDVIDASSLNPGQISLTLDGGAGDDTLIGSQGNDRVLGGPGNDVALLGAGDDVFSWAPGDGSDTVEGQAGFDRLDFNGANLNETITISANGEWVTFVRDVASVTMDLSDVEQATFHALGGADKIVINDVSGTDLIGSGVVVDLEGVAGSGLGDGQVDMVTANGTAGDSFITATSFNGFIGVVGTAAPVTIVHAESTDQLVINGNAGNDVIDASALVAGQISLTLNGGLGADVLIGSQGDDLVNGGDGNDLALMGAGDDTFVWNPGDDNDTIEGQAGVDTLLFNGANVNENINISANGGRATFIRDVANVTMDLDGTETIDFHALGGADTITVNDMSGTDVSKVRIDLAAAGGGGDGQVDTIVINATNGNDAVIISNNNGVVTVSGLAAEVTISGFEATDRIVINGLAGDDVIDGSRLGTAMVFSADGGDGADVLIGSDGADTLKGGAGDDVLIGGPGLDVLDGGAGDNVVIQSVAVGTPGNDIGVGTNHDVIQDFAGDVIALAAVDANLDAGGDQAFSFIGTEAFSAAGQLRFFADGAGNTIVEGNVDNNLGADFQIALHNFTGQLHTSDFLL